MQVEAQQPFYTKDGDHYLPGAFCAGPWDPKMLNARVVIGLLGAVIEERHGAAHLMPARLTVDLYRAADFSPVHIETRVIRDGRRVRVVEADFMSKGVSAARASCHLLARSQNSPGNVWALPVWTPPPPEDVPAMTARLKHLENVWEVRRFDEGYGKHAQGKAWGREVRELVAGQTLTPFQRCALAADFASPLANIGDGGIGYINSDMTLYLHRLPVGEYIGFEGVDQGATDGISHGHVFLHDVQGRIGSCSMAALAQKSPWGSPAK